MSTAGGDLEGLIDADAERYGPPRPPDLASARRGDDELPFAIPIVKDGTGWCFDTSAGQEQRIDRRIGRHELSAIQASLAYVDAQREYCRRNPDANPLMHYARRFLSSPGKRDGLYWRTAEGELESWLHIIGFADQRTGSVSTGVPRLFAVASERLDWNRL
jgi:hypothetical protein